MTLALSPCPNDTFIFHALLHKKIDTEGLSFEVKMLDIDELNRQAQKGKTDAIKISYAIYPNIHKQYRILSSGSALGYNSGPLLVSKTPTSLETNSRIAIPGKKTTAALLLQMFYPQFFNIHSCLFSVIPNSIISGIYNAGLLIHEARFTYEQKGLHLIADLGKLWEQKFNLPLPLGGIVINRNLAIDKQLQFARIMRRSVEYALKNPIESRTFVKHYAQELADNIIELHINMFVNKYTIELDQKAKKAIQILLQQNFSSNKNDVFF
ncbi:MAG: menaquinone biosynthesis family protein [Bacteroidales bacterium]